MTSKCIYLQGQYTAVGPSRRRGGCVEAESITIDDVTLNKVLIDKEAFDLLELGEIVELSFFTKGNETFITYIRYGENKLSPTPNFAYREFTKLGFRSMGLVLMLVLLISFVYPDIAFMGGSSTFLLPVAFGASLILPIIKYISIHKHVLSSKKTFPIRDV
ncbi:hypothetical protein FWP33_07270 [Vibrio parahaemolyticus]|nr:hypothetical protein [Vibrio parahaemolyticus]EJE4724422.1 hypothetical protein [Vibrio parahaemolyticus]